MRIVCSAMPSFALHVLPPSCAILAMRTVLAPSGATFADCHVGEIPTAYLQDLLPQGSQTIIRHGAVLARHTTHVHSCSPILAEVDPDTLIVPRNLLLLLSELHTMLGRRACSILRHAVLRSSSLSKRTALARSESVLPAPVASNLISLAWLLAACRHLPCVMPRAGLVMEFPDLR